MWARGLLVGLLAVTTGAYAQDNADAAAQAKQFVESLHFRSGEIAVPEAQAHFRLGGEFRYLEKADARRVLEQFWGNPPDDSVLGMVVPTATPLDSDESWAVVVTYSDEGYVSDEDAAKTDYDALLKELKEGTEQENAERKKAGYEEIRLVGWAVPPRYDGDSKKLYWAKELDFEGSPQHTLNYDIRVLGRRGYLSLNAVSGMSELETVRAGMQQLLPMTEFDSGARYADYNADTDKLAGYGIAALIGGGIAAKAGLFAKIGALLLGLKKLLIPLVLVLLAFGKKILGFFGRDKQDKA
ncbi:DUF2167 domain-containing protein [Luteimonas sp. SX5]|uniref:DUF2167 domain-containing protein n=1 Tax=Luteimonas galliterrae TaxID=2940486 RepID=A0ABT0MM56_9GAMM|nr:DUF2167 domain-containing protein [Luteimonas galliterrae]MCL1635961.1 DUF2167 domain-containing protein [Luteimonas galliterrae]